MLSDQKIAVLGAGNIGEALLGGLLKAELARPENITATCRTESRRTYLEERYGIQTLSSNQKAAAHAEVILLCVKPYGIPLLLEELGKVPPLPEALIISVAAGVEAVSIEAALGPRSIVIRAMPNTPALVDAGATAIALGRNARESHARVAEEIFGAVGSVCRVEEKHLDGVTGLSGSGPAYVGMIIEALSDAGVRVGLTRKVSLELAAQTVLGAAKLVQDGQIHPAVLKEQVTTPEGTAIHGIQVLERGGLRSLLIDAVVAATERARALSKPSKSSV